MNVRYRVDLNQIERSELKVLLSGGKHASRKLKRAQILLAADAGASDEEIARSVGVGGSTVYRTKRRFVEGNLERALTEEPRPGAERKLAGKEEALLVATACASPPQAVPAGRSSCWPCIGRSHPPKPGGSCDALSSTTLPNTQAGSTWSRSRSVSCGGNAWTAGSTTPSAYDAKSPLGSEAEMPPAHASNGCSQPTRPAPKWAQPIPRLPKSHNHCAGVLALNSRMPIR
jgi:hypothetical protein